MDPQEPLLDDLSSGDTAKQTNALTRLLSLSANGKDISIYFYGIIQHCMLEQKLKLLAYRVLKRCTLIDSEWEHKVIPHIARDASNDDQSLAIAALELIYHIPASCILVDFVGKLIFVPTFNHHAPAVRRASIEALSFLLLQKKAVLTSKVLVTAFWGSILNRLIDDTSVIVFQVAFRAISNLFDAVDTLSPLDNVDSFGDGFYDTRTNLLRRTIADIKTQLIPHFDLLLKRLDFIELPYRAPAINVLTCLMIEIPKDPIALELKPSSTLYPAVSTGALVSSFVESHLLPFLTHADDGLAFASGKAILRIWGTSTESHRRDWAVTATLGLVGILRRETIAISPGSIITEILRFMHLIPQANLISCTLKLITSIADFTDSLLRQKNLIKVFDLLVKKDLEGEGAIFALLFKDPWFASVWAAEASFREELLSAMVTQYSQFKSRYLDTKGKTRLSDKERISYLISSLKFIQLCSDTLKWQTGGRTHAVEQYIKFVDWQLEHVNYLPKGGNYDTIWQLQSQCLRNLMGNMTIIVSDGICLQVIFIVCKYASSLDSHDEQAITTTLQQRFLFLSEFASFKEVASSAAKAGSLIDLSGLRVHASPYMEGVLACLHILGVRFPKMANVVRQTLDSILTNYPSNEPLHNKVRVLQAKINASQTHAKQSPKSSPFCFGTDVTDFSFIPPLEYLDSLNNFESPNDRFKLDYKKSTTLHNQQHPVYNKFHKPCVGKILSGSSDPFLLTASHLMRPDSYTILFRVRILNQMSFPYTNLQVSVGLSGGLQVGEIQDTTQTVKKLNPEEKVDLEFPVLVTCFEMASATVHLTFFSLSPGEVSFNMEPSLDYDDYGRNYATTTVVSDVYEFELSEFLHPVEYSYLEFVNEWNRFPAGFTMDVAFDPSPGGVEALFAKLNLISPAFHQVLQWSYSQQYFQLAYSSMTWFEDQLSFSVIGQHPAPHEKLFARFVFRASDPVVLSIFHGQIERWFSEWVGTGKFSIVASADKNIFCAASGATIGWKQAKATSNKFDVEETMLNQWSQNRYARTIPPIPIPPPKAPTPPPPVRAPTPPPPSPDPLPGDDDFI